MLSKRTHCFWVQNYPTGNQSEWSRTTNDQRAPPQVNRNGTKCNRPNLTTRTAFLVPRRAISGPHNVPYFVFLHHKQLHVTKAVTWRIALQHRQNKTKRLTISFRVPVHTKKQVADLRANLSQISVFLLTTLSHMHTAQISFFYTNAQSNNLEPLTQHSFLRQPQTTACCCSASFAFLRVGAQGNQHRENRFHQHHDCYPGARITRILPDTYVAH
jgi:hypothetical protein